MATMIPDRPPEVDHSTGSERDLWKELKQRLSDEFYVYHSLPYLRTNARQSEVDFLVVHRKKGMLNIECKGGGVDRDEDGNWYRTPPDGAREYLESTPTEQATDQIEDIVAGLRHPLKHKLKKSFRKFPLIYGWALAFPYSRASDLNLPLSLQPEVLIDSSDVYGDLETAVVEALEFYAQRRSDRGLDEQDFARFRSVVSPPMSIPAEVMAAALDRERSEIVKLSDRQTEMIWTMLANRRVRVPGGAGTGKTVLAIHAAKTLADRGEDVLLTCFNIDLGRHLRNAVEAFDDLPGRIDAFYFHELCTLADDDLGGVLDHPDADASPEEISTFWRDETAEVLFDAAAAGELSVGPWDAIIVDEGQDFAGSWWTALDACLRDRDEGRMVIFYDEEQAIFDRKPCVPTDGAVFPLRENFRNTVAIFEKVEQLTDSQIKPHPGAPTGEPPKVYQQPGPSKTRRMLGELIDDLVEREKLDYRQIAILTPHSSKNSSLEGATELGGHPVVEEVSRWSDGVLHSTIGSFKGLESDVVIMVDIDPTDPRCSVNDRYVAASRAVHRLYVFEKGHWLKGS